MPPRFRPTGPARWMLAGGRSAAATAAGRDVVLSNPHVVSGPPLSPSLQRQSSAIELATDVVRKVRGDVVTAEIRRKDDRRPRDVAAVGGRDGAARTCTVTRPRRGLARGRRCRESPVGYRGAAASHGCPGPCLPDTRAKLLPLNDMPVFGASTVSDATVCPITLRRKSR